MIDVSVVIPTFRRPALLSEAIASALAQRDVSVEVIVVDDSPEGSAREVVSNLGDPRVRYVQQVPPTGGRPALVRNHGGSLARGRFVHFLDDDDRAIQGFYADARAAFERHPTCGVVFGAVEPFGDEAALVHERKFFRSATRRARLWQRTQSRRWMAAILLFQDTVLVNSAGMIRRECIEGIGGYSTDIAFNEDVEFYARALRKYGGVLLPRAVIEYRILGDSLMHGRDDDAEIAVSYRRMYERYRRTNGALEFFALKVFSRTVLRLLDRVAGAQ